MAPAAVDKVVSFFRERYRPAATSDAEQTPSEKPSSTASTHLFFRDVVGAWAYEIVTWLIAVGLLIAIYMILDKANNKPVDDWDFQISLNTLAATISTVFRALLVAIAAEILSQQKWIWFWSMSRTRSLQDLQNFDQGSRGIWGAVALIPTIVLRSATSSIAVLIIILSFAIGPFVQQAIFTELRSMPDAQGSASLPVSYRITSNDTYFRTMSGSLVGMWNLKYDVRSVFYSATMNPKSSSNSITASCSTGNCTFPNWGAVEDKDNRNITHASIGICSKCTDVSELITLHSANSTTTTYDPPRASLPNGIEVQAVDMRDWMYIQGSGNLSWAESIIPAKEAAFFQYAFTNITVLSMTAYGQPEGYESRYTGMLDPTNATAASCSLYPCLRSYAAAVNNGKLSEKLVHTKPLYPDLANSTAELSSFNAMNYSMPQTELMWAAVHTPCRVDDETYTAANMSKAQKTTTMRLLTPGAAPEYPSKVVPEGCVFGMQGFYYAMIGQFLATELFNGSCTWDARQGEDAVCKDHWWLSQFWEKNNASFTSISDRFSTISTALTNQFRLGLARDDTAQTKVQGTALQTRTYTNVKWNWLLYPTLLLGIETAILGWMIVRSWLYRHEERVWKSNILPLLYYRDRFAHPDGGESVFKRSAGQVEHLRGDEQLMTMRDMTHEAKHTTVRFRRGHKPEAPSDDDYSSGRQDSLLSE